MRFESYGTFMKAALGPSAMADSERSSRDKDRESFYGGTWEEAKTKGLAGDIQTGLLLRQGIIRGANRIMGQVTRLDPVFRADRGIWIDVSRYLSGEPEVWGDMIDDNAERRARRVAVVLGAGVNCFVNASDYEKVMVGVGGTILGLKASGIQVSLYLCYRNDGRDTDITAIDMTAGGAFDISRLAAMTRTWFFRRLVFSWWETRTSKFRGDHGIERGGGYGHSTSMTRQNAIDVSGIPNAVVFNVDQMTGHSEENIRKMILSSIKDAEKVTVKRS